MTPRFGRLNPERTGQRRRDAHSRTYRGTLPSAPGEFRWGREGEILACPWHGWEFDLLTGKALADTRRHLRLFPVTVEDDTVFVTL